MRALLTVALFAAAGCQTGADGVDAGGFGQLLGGGSQTGSGQGGGLGGSGGSGGSGGGGALPTKVYPGVVPTGLQPGAYWDIASRSEGVGRSSLLGYRLTLGRAVTLDGVSGFEVTVTLLWWWSSSGGTPSLPSIRYLSFSDGFIRKRDASGPWRTVFSEYGPFEGVYLFEEGDQTVAPRDSAYLGMSTQLRNEASVPTVSQVLSNSLCRDYPELGGSYCTGGGSETATGRGHFKTGEGFIGHSQRNCIQQGCTTDEVAVVRFSRTGPAPACSGEGACCLSLGLSRSVCPAVFCSDPSYPTDCPASGSFARGCWGPGVACSTRTQCGSSALACSDAAAVPDCSTRACAPRASCTNVPSGTCGNCAQTYCCARVAEWNRTGLCDDAWALAACLDTSCGGCRFPPSECAIP